MLSMKRSGLLLIALATGLIEPVGGDWEIISSTHRWEQTDAWTFTLNPEIEARGETVVEYRVRVRWC